MPGPKVRVHPVDILCASHHGLTISESYDSRSTGTSSMILLVKGLRVCVGERDVRACRCTRVRHASCVPDSTQRERRVQPYPHSTRSARKLTPALAASRAARANAGSWKSEGRSAKRTSSRWITNKTVALCFRCVTMWACVVMSYRLRPSTPRFVSRLCVCVSHL